jgi:hypothetical protein
MASSRCQAESGPGQVASLLGRSGAQVFPPVASAPAPAAGVTITSEVVLMCEIDGGRMSHMLLWVGLVLSLGICASIRADAGAVPEVITQVGSQSIRQVIVQIGGRFCEYHRRDVESALRRYPAVQGVEFPNDHGTVLIRYEESGLAPTELAESAARAAFGIGCRAWVDDGRQQQSRS